MAAYRPVYDSRHLQADCQEPGSAPEPKAWQSSMVYLHRTPRGFSATAEHVEANTDVMSTCQPVLSSYAAAVYDAR